MVARGRNGGRKPVPTILQELHGRPNPNWRPPPAEAVPVPPDRNAAAELGPPPAYFTPEQAAEWEDIIRPCPPGLLTSFDRRIVEMLAIATTEMRGCSRRLSQQEARTYVGEHGVERTLPDYNNLMKALALVMRASSELGFTPVSRPKADTRVMQPGQRPIKPGDDRITARVRLRGVPADVDLETYLNNRPALPSEIGRKGRNAA
jgi:phage terminase small subunit